MLHLIEQRIKKAIEERVFPGCVVGIARKGANRTILPFGTSTYDSNASLIKEDSIFDVASITKAIPTSSLALKLMDENKLKLDDRVIDYILELRSSQRERILVAEYPDSAFRVAHTRASPFDANARLRVPLVGL